MKCFIDKIFQRNACLESFSIVANVLYLSGRGLMKGVLNAYSYFNTRIWKDKCQIHSYKICIRSFLQQAQFVIAQLFKI